MIVDESTQGPSMVRSAIHQGIMISLRLLQYAFFGAKRLLSISRAKVLPENDQNTLNHRLENSFDHKLSEIASKLSESGGTLIFYGSQSGVAKNFARALSYKLSTVLIESVVCDTSEYNMEYFLRLVRDYGNKITVGFIVATYGEGGPTDNFSDFFEWITEIKQPHSTVSDPDTDQKSIMSLENLRYYMFGLGNSTYRDYNGASITLDLKLNSLGARRLGNLVLSDECLDQNATFEAWLPEITKMILDESGVSVNSEDYKVKFRTLPHKCPVHLIDQKSPEWKEPNIVFKGCIGAKRTWNWIDSHPYLGYKETNPSSRALPIYSPSKPFYAKVLSSRLMYTDTYDTYEIENKSLEWTFPDLISLPAKVDYKDGVVTVERQCVHIDISIDSPGIEYSTGDYLSIFPRNNPCEVERLIKALGWEDIKDVPVEMIKNNDVHSLNRRPPIVGAFTPAAAFEHYYDITAPLTQERLDIIARYATVAEVSDKLFNLSQSYESYNELVLTPRRNLADVLLDFNSSFSIPREVVIGELFDRITPRNYSIASSSVESPKVVSIVAVVVRYAQALPQIGQVPEYVRGREGLATSWLQRSHRDNLFANVKGPDTISAGRFPLSYIPLYRKSSSFKPPSKLSVPIIMIGPGTGVAPFRAFIRERCYYAKEGKNVGHTILFYGCRTPNSHLYKEEFEELIAQKPENFKLEIFNAYSRIRGEPPIYVLDHMKEQEHKIYSILEKHKGTLYVCGDKKYMGTDTRKTINDIYLKLCPGASPDIKYTDKLASEGRYFEDLW